MQFNYVYMTWCCLYISTNPWPSPLIADMGKKLVYKAIHLSLTCTFTSICVVCLSAESSKPGHKPTAYLLLRWIAAIEHEQILVLQET